MIMEEVHENILESRIQTLVCPVNTSGVMGAGLAKSFKDKYPDLFKAYQRACRENVFSRQGIFVYTHSDKRKILCLPTKRHWKFKSQLEWVINALEIIKNEYQSYDITSLAMPAIGCGLGGLDWDVVYPLIKKYLDPIDLPTTIYLP